MSAPTERGAALLDVLIAVAITAMLAGALTQVTRFGLTVVERGADASARSATELVERRTLIDLLSRIDAVRPDRPTAVGNAEQFLWRGVQPDDGGWVAVTLKVKAEDDSITLYDCASFQIEETCNPLAVFAGDGPISYAAANGVFSEIWPEGPAPHVVKIGDLAIQPRVAGAVR